MRAVPLLAFSVNFLNALLTTLFPLYILGIGLTLAKKLVELHGGSVKAHSEGLGKGSTFTVTFPLPAVIEKPSEEIPAKERDAGRLQGVRVLVVEDEAARRAA